MKEKKEQAHPVPLPESRTAAFPEKNVGNAGESLWLVQGYLAHKIQRPPRTLQWDYA